MPSIERIIAEDGVAIVPNPTTANWMVHIRKDAMRVKVQLTTAAGQTLWVNESGTNTDGLIAIPGAALPAGIYFLNLTIDGRVSNHRLIKQ